MRFWAIPSHYHHYIRLMRLHAPIGIALLLWPCYWGVVAGASRLQHSLSFVDITRIALLFTVGAVVMRSAGCIINDIIDRDIDRQVVRTATRPLASGEISLGAALLLLAFLVLTGLLVAIALPLQALIWACAALPLVVIYPFCKRLIWWPQLWLGITFNWGVLVGWFAVNPDFDITVVLLYVAGIFWTLGYDTVYAHQDRIDDEKIGVKSTAQLYKNHRYVLPAFSYLGMMVCLGVIGMRQSPPGVWQIGYGAIGVGIFLLQIWWLYCWNPSQPASCARHFKRQFWIGGAVMTALFML